MKKALVAGSVFAFVAVSPTAAADMLTARTYKAPAVMATGYNWTGFYIGGNAGYAWGGEDTTLGIVDDPATCHFCGTPSSDGPTPQGAGSPSFNPKGFTGGGQFGYNWQASNWVYGIEIDYQAFDQHQTINNSFALNNLTGGLACLPASNTCAGSFSSSIKTDWLFTARPRLGYAWDRTMVYATGGLALTKISFSQSYADNANFGSPPGGSESAAGSKTVVGWAVGGGLEQALGNRWSVKAEYLYTQFGGLTAFGRLTDGFGDFSNFTNNVGQLSSHTVRAGINYKFSGP
jgi:outer membrane immunogenic protein